MLKLSLVIPVMNERENIQPLLEQIHAALLGISYEVILVDDGSSDGTPEEIRKYIDGRVILVELMKNYGQSTAMSAGIDHAKGEYVVTLDGDLQNDPSDIPMLLEKIEAEPWDMIAGNRANRQ
ncbi:MAG: glycosyltransferase, partial [Bacteroidota bacterium]